MPAVLPTPDRPAHADAPLGAIIVRQFFAHLSSEPQTFTAAFTIGRATTCAVVVSHPRVSRKHVTVEPTAAGWRATCEAGRRMFIEGRWTTSAILTKETRIQLVDEFGPLIALAPAGAAGGALAASAASAASAALAASTVMLGSAGAAGTTALGSAGITMLKPPTGIVPTAVVPSGDLAATGEITISGSGTIGRRPDNSLTVNDPTMSGRHARVEVTPQGAVVTDLASTKWNLCRRQTGRPLCRDQADGVRHGLDLHPDRARWHVQHSRTRQGR